MNSSRRPKTFSPIVIGIDSGFVSKEVVIRQYWRLVSLCITPKTTEAHALLVNVFMVLSKKTQLFRNRIFVSRDNLQLAISSHWIITIRFCFKWFKMAIWTYKYLDILQKLLIIRLVTTLRVFLNVILPRSKSRVRISCPAPIITGT